MGKKANLRAHRTGKQAKVRSFTATNTHKRHLDPAVGNGQSSGRSRRDNRTRSQVRYELKSTGIGE